MACSTRQPDIRRVALSTGANSRQNIDFYLSEGYELKPPSIVDRTVHLTKNVPVGQVKVATVRATHGVS